MMAGTIGCRRVAVNTKKRRKIRCAEAIDIQILDFDWRPLIVI